MLSAFADSSIKKLKHNFKQHSGVTYFQLLDHMWSTCMKLHQLNITELLTKMKECYDVNEGFTRHINSGPTRRQCQKMLNPKDTLFALLTVHWLSCLWFKKGGKTACLHTFHFFKICQLHRQHANAVKACVIIVI